MVERINVPLLERSYDIVIEAGLLSRAAELIAPKLKSPRVIIVTDEVVGPLYAAKLKADCVAHGIRADVVTLPAGESTKGFSQFETLMDMLLSLQPDRRTTLVALGGGVIGDITGFAASVLLRGVDFVQVPTTLLAQVDSSVGGKTGINTKQGKNLVGSFYQPLKVLVDTDTLKTLPKRECLAGYAEILKYGLIGDAEFYAWLLRHGEELLAGNEAYVTRAIARSCEMKAAIVGVDERESAARALLNFGHTFGHALEAEMGYSGALLHGEAVAIGMVMACRLSQQISGLPASVEDGLVAHLKQVGMKAHPKDVAAKWDAQTLMHHMAGDKKAEDGKLTFIVLDAVGKARVVKDVPKEIAQNVVNAFVNA
jgi:3-dehydroquinate synthase